jgi:predicted dehydrogenase
MAVAALEAGKHVLCEKPFAVDVEEARAMREAARRRGDRTAMLGHLFRWAPQRAYVKELLSQGYIGDLQFVQGSLFVGSRRNRQPRPSAGPDLGHRGGLLWSIGSHYLDCYRHWFGDVSSVQANLATHLPEPADADTGDVRRSGADDAFSIVMEFRSGGWGSFTASNAVVFGQGAQIEIFGSEGSLSTPQPPPLATNPPPDGRVLGGRATDPERAELPMPRRFRPFDDERDHRLMAFRLMVREFLRGVREGGSPSPSFEDGYRLQLVLDAAVESADTGRRVSIPPE